MPKDNTDRKPRSDSKLKTLAVDVQDELGKKLETDSLKAARKWLSETHAVSSSLSALSAFLPWWQAMRRLRASASLSEAMKDFLLAQGSTPDEAISQSAAAFTAMTAGDGDAKSFSQMLNSLSRWNDSRAKRDMAARKAEQEQGFAKPSMTPADRARRQREILGVSSS